MNINISTLGDTRSSRRVYYQELIIRRHISRTWTIKAGTGGSDGKEMEISFVQLLSDIFLFSLLAWQAPEKVWRKGIRVCYF